MESRRYRVLAVDDEPAILRLLSFVLDKAGYACEVTDSGAEALRRIEAGPPPDLLVLDVNMPDMDGLTLCRRIKKNLFLSRIPVLLLTARTRVEDRVEGLETGADDYLCKPFDNRELVARVHALIRHTVREADRNPTTDLPGNAAVERELQARLDRGEPLAVCYPDLDDFKAYSDTYGFDAANKVIRMTGRIVAGVVMLEGERDDFVGHIGGDDFIVLTAPERAEGICRKIVREFDEKIPAYYRPAHRADRGFVARDREGRRRKFPLMSISIAVVVDTRRAVRSLSEIGLRVARVKKRAKELAGSGYVIERC